MANVIDILKERGFIDAITSEELRTAAEQPLKVYCGFDPTGDSLHLGSLVALMGLAWFQKCGHTPVAIVGGATGMIGDPSGKTSERQLLDEKTIENNLLGIRQNIDTVLSYSKNVNPPLILNNLDWFKEFSFIGFLRDVGKYFRMGPMLAKDSVRVRMQSEEGMSFTEFSYQLLQGYDFLYLYDCYGVTVQMGGSDQWGNITAGVELIRKVKGKSAFGLTFPLLVRSDGQKFGKSEKGAVWLSPERCSPYEFFQYLVRVPDADVIMLMRLITFMEMSEIREYEALMKTADYAPNTAQKRLAEEVTRLIHGQGGLDVALRVTKAAAPGTEATLDLETLESISSDMPSFSMPLSSVIGKKVIDILLDVQLLLSKGEARRLIQNGGVYLNNAKVMDVDASIIQKDLLDGRLMLLSAGKKKKVIIRVL